VLKNLDGWGIVASVYELAASGRQRSGKNTTDLPK